MNHDSFYHLEITKSNVLAILKYSYTLHNENFNPYAYGYFTPKKKFQLLEVKLAVSSRQLTEFQNSKIIRLYLVLLKTHLSTISCKTKDP